MLRASRKQEKSWLQIVLASDGDLATQREFVRNKGLGDFQYVVSAPLGMTYQVSRLPFAALVDAERQAARARPGQLPGAPGESV